MAEMKTQTIDPHAYKARIRDEWGASTADGWRRWHSVIESPEAGAAVSRRLVELSGVGPGDTVLDVACGYGEPALTAAAAVRPGGRVVCSDISASMLAFARERASDARFGDVAFEFVECDGEELVFRPDTFDAVISRWGIMFFTDLVGTLARYRSFLRRDGRFAAVVWGPPSEVQWSIAMPVVLSELELPPPATGGPGVFALADLDVLASAVRRAGFRDVETGTVDVPMEAADASEFTAFIRAVSAPISDLVKSRPPDVQERVWGKVRDAYAALAPTDDGRVRTLNRANWVAGTR